MNEGFVPQLAVEVRGSVRLALLEASPVLVRPAGTALVSAMEDLAREMKARFEGRPPSEIPGLEPARKLYRRFGVDPTRTRPSSEALVRRAVQGKPLPRVSNAVDVCNLCSMRFLLPIGLYDTGKVRGSIVLRTGKAGESYPGIRKDEVGLEGRLVLADEQGPFGNPSSDSFRTCVEEGTTALLMVVFAPSDYPADALRAHGGTAAELAELHLAPPGESIRTSTAVLS